MELGVFEQDGAMRQRYAELDELSDETKEYLDRLRSSREELLETYEISYLISWIYHENGLEGIVLSYPEIRSAVDNRVISDVSLLPTYQYVKNLKSCIDTMRAKALNKRFTVTISYLKSLHGRLVDNPELVGVYRKDIPIHRTYFHEIAHPTKIQSSLAKVLDYLKARRPKELHPIELAANVHHRFMRVFPFSHYSGILGRMLANFVLLRHGYIPIIIHSTDRQRYYEALRGPERQFRTFISDAMQNSLENAFKFSATLEFRAAQ